MSPMYAALASAFWDNTSAAKPAGHPVIPASLAQSAFIVTLLGKDSAAVAKVFPRIKTGLTGRLQPMISLMNLGKPELAKQLAPPLQQPFISEDLDLRYTRKLEDSIAALKKEGVDPMTALKLEIDLLGLIPGKESEAPVESYDARLRRITEAFAASPPTGNALTLSLQQIVGRAPGDAKLAPLVNKWLNDNPLAGLLIRSDRSSNELSSQLREAGTTIHGIMAAEAFGAGDSSRIEAIRKEFEQKTGRDYEASQIVINLMRTINLSIWRQVCVGNTSGFKSGMTAWNEMVLQASKQIVNYDPSEVRQVLAASLLLACLTDRQEAFGQLVDKMPERSRSYVKGINRDGGFFNFIEAMNYRDSLEYLPENATRKIFLEKVLSQPGFARSLTTQVGWVNRMAEQYGFRKEIDLLSVNPPANAIPESLPALYEYGGRLAYKTDPEKGIALTRKGLDGCPEGEAWNGSRGMLKWQLADQLLASKKADEAKEIFVTIKPEEVAGWLKDRYNKTAKALGIEPPKPEAPKKDAPAPPKP
jgi:hypothetical protein